MKHYKLLILFTGLVLLFNLIPISAFAATPAPMGTTYKWYTPTQPELDFVKKHMDAKGYTDAVRIENNNTSGDDYILWLFSKSTITETVNTSYGLSSATLMDRWLIIQSKIATNSNAFLYPVTSASSLQDQTNDATSYSWSSSSLDTLSFTRVREAGVYKNAFATMNPADTPSGLSATSTDKSITLNWNAVPNSQGYRVYDSSNNKIYDGSELSYTNSGLTFSTQYTYSVTAYNAYGESSKASISFSTLPEPDSDGDGFSDYIDEYNGPGQYPPPPTTDTGGSSGDTSGDTGTTPDTSNGDSSATTRILDRLNWYYYGYDTPYSSAGYKLNSFDDFFVKYAGYLNTAKHNLPSDYYYADNLFEYSNAYGSKSATFVYRITAPKYDFSYRPTTPGEYGAAPIYLVSDVPLVMFASNIGEHNLRVYGADYFHKDNLPYGSKYNGNVMSYRAFNNELSGIAGTNLKWNDNGYDLDSMRDLKTDSFTGLFIDSLLDATGADVHVSDLYTVDELKLFKLDLLSVNGKVLNSEKAIVNSNTGEFSGDNGYSYNPEMNKYYTDADINPYNATTPVPGSYAETDYASSPDTVINPDSPTSNSTNPDGDRSWFDAPSFSSCTVGDLGCYFREFGQLLKNMFAYAFGVEDGFFTNEINQFTEYVKGFGAVGSYIDLLQKMHQYATNPQPPDLDIKIFNVYVDNFIDFEKFVEWRSALRPFIRAIVYYALIHFYLRNILGLFGYLSRSSDIAGSTGMGEMDAYRDKHNRVMDRMKRWK